MSQALQAPVLKCKTQGDLSLDQLIIFVNILIFISLAK